MAKSLKCNNYIKGHWLVVNDSLIGIFFDSMMKRVLLCFFIIVQSSSFLVLIAQSHWDSLPGLKQCKDESFDLTVLYADSNYLYMAAGMDSLEHKSIRGIARWNGLIWDSLGRGDSWENGVGQIEAIVTYHNKLYVGGGFDKLGNVNALLIGTWNGGSWDSLPVQPFTFKNDVNIGDNAVDVLTVINNKLYLAGGANSINGLPGFTGVAVWNDTSWSSLNFPQYLINFNTFGGISSIVEYKGDIYVVGIFGSDTNSNILRWHGNNWLQVGGGIKGGNDWPNCMIVYDSNLYVAGYFWKQDGNIGNNIQRWDGVQWHDVGGGINWEVFNLQVYNNKLYAMGTFDSAGGIWADEIALWNNTQWCSLGDLIDTSAVGCSCVYKNSLYIGGGFWGIDGNSAYTFMAEWTGGNYTYQCGKAETGEKELKTTVTQSIIVYPNPNSGEFNIQWIVGSGQWLENTHTIEIFDVYGQKIYSSLINQSHFGKLNASLTTIHLNVPDGIYFYRVLQEDGSLAGNGKVIIVK